MGRCAVFAVWVLLLLGVASPAVRCAVMPGGTTADYVLVKKGERKLILLRRGVPLKIYVVALGRNPVGRKEREGDRKTPEGKYLIDRRKEDSRFHKALHVSYPNQDDKVRARSRGISPGGDIMIHGIQNGLGWIGRWHRLVDWTSGCIAVTDEEIEEIMRLVPDGTPVEITP